MLRRLFLLSPLPFVPVPGVFKGEPKEPREARCGCSREKKGKNEGGPVVNIFPQVALLNNTAVVANNTTAEVTLFTYPVPPGHLDGTHGVRVRIYTGTTTTLSDAIVTYTFSLKLGATEIWAEDYLSTEGNQGRLWEWDVMAKNASDEQVVFGAEMVAGYYSAASTEDGLTALDLALTVQMTVTDASESEPGNELLYAAAAFRRAIVELL